MFADHSNHATSSFTPPWARHLAARVVASISRKGHVPRAEVLPRNEASDEFVEPPSPQIRLRKAFRCRRAGVRLLPVEARSPTMS
jgi:hypothetical protein